MTDPGLPPGVRLSMVPGFRPEDEEYERYAEDVTDGMIVEWVIDHDLDCDGCVIYEWDEQVSDLWALESDRKPWLHDWPHELKKTKAGKAYSLLLFESRWDAIAYAVCFEGDRLTRAMTEKHIDDLADRAYDEPDEPYPGAWA